MHNDWTVLFKQRLKTTQVQLDKRKAFLEEMKRTFWAPQPNCEERLNEDDRKFLEIMKTSREGGASSLERKTLAKNKEKLKRSLQKQERIYKEEQRKINLDTKLSTFATHSNESSENSSFSESEENNDMYVPTSSKRQKQQNEKRGTVSLKADAKHWSETVGLVADKHHISHKGFTEVMSAVISTGGGNIADISLSKDTTRRHRNKIRKQNAATIMEKILKLSISQRATETCCSGMEKCCRVLNKLEHPKKSLPFF